MSATHCQITLFRSCSACGSEEVTVEVEVEVSDFVDIFCVGGAKITYAIIQVFLEVVDSLLDYYTL